MKKIISAILLLCLATALFAAIPTTAANTRLFANKTEYEFGEQIMITATGGGTDWVGLYLRGEIPGTGIASIYWTYVADVSGQATAIKSYENKGSTRSDYFDIPSGDYTVYLLENDGYNIIEKVDIKVKPTAANVPFSATYEKSTDISYRADGVITFTAEDKLPSGYTVYWANESGPLDDFGAFSSVSCNSKETTLELPSHTLIPRGADRFLICIKGGSLDNAVTVMLPSDAMAPDIGAPTLRFSVLSDIHINSTSSHTYNQNFKAALQDIVSVAPSTEAIFINGDIADRGSEAEYEEYNKMVDEYSSDIPVYCSIGNHDFRGGKNDAGQIEMFLNATGSKDKVYYDMYIGDVHYIMLGSERNADGSSRAYLSNEQLSWLSKTLAQDRGKDTPVFVFLHQGIKDTVAGTRESEIAVQNWHGIQQEAKFKKILSDYPQVVLFSGHSHWTLQSPNSMTLVGESSVTALNTASVAYLWDDRNAHINGSQGYFVEMYEDMVIFRGRNFEDGVWIPEAQFVLELSTKDDAEQDENETEANTLTDAPENTPAATDGAEKGGCGSFVGGGAMLYACVSALLAAILSKKKRINKK